MKTMTRRARVYKSPIFYDWTAVVVTPGRDPQWTAANFSTWREAMDFVRQELAS